MKTAQTIAQNAERDAAEKPRKDKLGRRINPKSLENLVAPWTPETRPHSTGRPKKDKAAEIARRILENNDEAVYKALAAKLLGGDAYAFSVLADRGYGKLKQTNVMVGDEEGGPIQASIKVEFVKPEGDVTK